MWIWIEAIPVKEYIFTLECCPGFRLRRHWALRQMIRDESLRCNGFMDSLICRAYVWEGQALNCHMMHTQDSLWWWLHH